MNVTSEDTPEGGFRDSRSAEGRANLFLVTTAEAEPEIGNIPGALQWLVLCHESEGDVSLSVYLKSPAEPVDGTAGELVQVSLPEVPLVS